MMRLSHGTTDVEVTATVGSDGDVDSHLTLISANSQTA